ncbi:MAG: hypothetical protein JWM86_561 [Thermoleophilia bacterium]|nr:hypothetical protein [Thermoleophilia bacterium]
MRIGVLISLLLATCVALAGCGDSTAPRRGAAEAGAGTIRLHPVEVRGGSFIEGFVAFEQHVEDDEWTPLRRLDASKLVTLERSTGVRVWIRPCDAACGAEDQLLERFRRGRASDPRSWDRLDQGLIRCQVLAIARRKRVSDLVPIIDVRRGAGCDWSGTAIDSERCEPSSVRRDVTSRPRVVSPETLVPGTYRFVEARGCTADERSVYIREGRWRGRTDDCNSATGTWKRDATGSHWYDRSSTLIACGGDLGLHETEHMEEFGGRFLQFRDRDGFTIAVARRS